MIERPYSEKERAAWIFSDLLNYIGRRGWFSAWPSTTGEQSLLYVSFHMHPDDATHVSNFIENAISTYDGNTRWKLNCKQGNRFTLCPSQVAELANEIGNFGNAASEVRKSLPQLEHDAAADLILLADHLYKVYLNGKLNQSDIK